MHLEHRALRTALERFTRRSQASTGMVLVAPVLLILIVVNLYPALYQIYISFTSYRLGSPLQSFVGLSNYGRLLQDPRFWESLRITLAFLVYTIPAQLALGLLFALLLNASRHRKYFLPFLLLPVVTTPVVVGYMFQYMFREDYGLISYFMRLLHVFPGFNLTANPSTVVPALALVDIWEWTPFVMIVLLAGLQSLPLSVYEAARVDGASPWATFRHVTLPLLRNQFLVALLFRTVDGLRIFDIIHSMTRGGPGTSSESLSIYLQVAGFKFGDLGYAAAMGMVLLIIGVTLANAYLRLIGNQLTGKV
ncbi:carbohydrate ABC transporter permease [Limnochorda pilosa]|uniref:ABC transporter permease n=1 Tax=Limnochorda pilosa TaxID=1555112 RepID=A0A0K2SGV0_LIMPI|nr:sugar ABC transporter permease [Limnochorda pilosa]BAS26252.1 ABC transporter permease [Limnochorda pilosa]